MNISYINDKTLIIKQVMQVYASSHFSQFYSILVLLPLFGQGMYLCSCVFPLAASKMAWAGSIHPCRNTKTLTKPNYF